MYLTDEIMGRAAKEGGTFIDFLKDMGDKKVRSPDSGNDVKLKSLKGDRGRKIQQAEFQKWLKKNEGKDDGGGGKEGEGRLNRLTGALGKGAASIKKFATDSSYRKEVFEAMKAKKGEAVKFAKAQAKQTKEMFETIKNIMEAPPVPSPDEKMKASILYARYTRWCEVNNERAISSTAFGLRMGNEGYEKVKKGSVYYLGLTVDANMEG